MKISWGKMLIGAAFAAGAVAAFIYAEPYLENTVVPVIKELGLAIGDKIAQAWSWIGQHIIGGAMPAITEAAQDGAQIAGDSARGIVGFVMKNQALSVGTAAAAGAIIAARTQHGHPIALPQEMITPQQESWVMREDMKRMQALMQARAATFGQGGVPYGMGRG